MRQRGRVSVAWAGWAGCWVHRWDRYLQAKNTAGGGGNGKRGELGGGEKKARSQCMHRQVVGGRYKYKCCEGGRACWGRGGERRGCGCGRERRVFVGFLVVTSTRLEAAYW